MIKCCNMDELKLEQDERRTSVAASTSNTELDENKEVKHVFLLTGEKECEL